MSLSARSEGRLGTASRGRAASESSWPALAFPPFSALGHLLLALGFQQSSGAPRRLPGPPLPVPRFQQTPSLQARTQAPRRPGTETSSARCPEGTPPSGRVTRGASLAPAASPPLQRREQGTRGRQQNALLGLSRSAQELGAAHQRGTQCSVVTPLQGGSRKPQPALALLELGSGVGSWSCCERGQRPTFLSGSSLFAC